MNSIIKNIGLLVLSFSLSISIFAQNWEVNPANYEFSMNIIGKVLIDGDILDNENSVLGAFVDGNCVGVTSPISHSGNYTLFYITVYSDSFSGSQISFRFKDSDENITEISNTVLFVNDKLIGSDTEPIIFMDVELYSSTDILEYSINEQITDAVIIPIERLINVIVSYNTDISVLTPAFRLAPGALAYSDDIEQTSSISVQDFANPVIYNVIGIDGASAQWTVSVSVDNSSIEGIVNSDLNIYPNPANDCIYIDFDGEPRIFEIYDINGKLIKTQKVSNGINTINTSELKKGKYFMKFSNQLRLGTFVILR